MALLLLLLLVHQHLTAASCQELLQLQQQSSCSRAWVRLVRLQML
jgi:hypothetical protein